MLINGVMAFGSSCALLMIVLFSIFALRNDPFFRFIIGMGVLCPIGAALWGLLAFNANEDRYLRNKEEGSEHQPAPYFE